MICVIISETLGRPDLFSPLRLIALLPDGVSSSHRVFFFTTRGTRVLAPEGSTAEDGEGWGKGKCYQRLEVHGLVAGSSHVRLSRVPVALAFLGFLVVPLAPNLLRRVDVRVFLGHIL